MARPPASADPDLAAHRLDEPGRVVADAVLEHDLDVLDVGDALRRISLHEDEVGAASLPQGAEVRLPAHEAGPVLRRDLDRLDRRESRLDQELDLALVAVTRQDAAVAGRIGS